MQMDDFLIILQKKNPVIGYNKIKMQADTSFAGRISNSQSFINRPSFFWINKKKSGRLLGGQIYNEMPLLGHHAPPIGIVHG